MKNGQASIISAVALIGVALTIGIAVLAYFNSLSGSYSEQLNLINTLNKESVVQLVRSIAVDPATGNVWLLVRRLDNSTANFFFIFALKETSGATTLYRLAPCDGDVVKVYFYKPSADTDGIVCNTPEDCVMCSSLSTSDYCFKRSVDLNEVFALTPNGISDFVSFVRGEGAYLDTTYTSGRAYVCGLRYTGGNGIVLVNIKDMNKYDSLIVFQAVSVNDRYYVVGEHEVSLVGS